MKKIVAFILSITLCLSLFGCSNSIKGKYTSESGLYTVEFKDDDECLWYQDGFVFYGAYEKIDSGWQLSIQGNSMYLSSTFIAIPEGNNLRITGGIVNAELFKK